MSWKPTVPWPYPGALPTPPQRSLAEVLLTGWVLVAALWAITFLITGGVVPGGVLILLIYGTLVPITVALLIASALYLARKRARREESEAEGDLRR